MARRRTRKPVEGVVSSLSDEGLGVVHVDQRDAHVYDALAGERVVYRRMRSRGTHAEAQLIELLESSPQRVEPPCPHAGMCGGCRLQHLSVEHQVEHKRGVLRRKLAAAGLDQVPEFDPICTPHDLGYRRRARLGVRHVAKKGKVLVGFRERDARYVADLHTCPMLAGDVGSWLGELSELVSRLSIIDQLPQVEVAVGDDAVALVFRVLEPPTDEDRAHLRDFAARHGARVFLQSGGLDTVTPLDQGTPAELHYSVSRGELDLAFLPTDFVQVNAYVNEVLLERAIELLQVGPADQVLDLFCGLGNFSLPLAQRAGSVVGVEGDAGLVERARANATRNAITNARFEVVDLYSEDALTSLQTEGFDRVVLDPPRTGAEPILDAVAASGAKRVVYVACSPETLARDLAIMVQRHGFELEGAGIADMFPHTAHVESIASLRRA